MNRTLNVVRMQLVNRATFLWVPLIVLGGTILLTLAVWGIITSAGVEAQMFCGGAQAPLWYFLAVGIQSLTYTFPFSQAMSVTRREFFLGTLLTAALTAVVLTAVFIVGGYIEEATSGWGMNGYMFRLPWVWEAGPLGAALFFFTMAMLFFVLGFWFSTIFKRYGTIGLTVSLIGLGLLLVGGMWLIGRLEAWEPVFTTLAGLGAVGLAAWGLVLTALLVAASYTTLRRAIP